MNDLDTMLKQEYAYRVNRQMYRFFEPTGKGEQFVNLVGSDKYFITLLSAANGIGKTTLAINMLAHLFWPVGNQFFQQPLWKKWRYLKKGRIISDPTTIKEAIIPEMKKWFPEGRYTTNKAGKAYEYKWKTDTGFEFDIMSFDQDIKEFESTTLGWAWLDEPPPRSVFTATVSRMRRGGIIWITATPLTGSAWLYDDIIANPDNEKGLRTFIEADVWSASKEKGVRGFLETKDIERMISQYDEEDKQARIYGKFQHLTGLIFKRFSREIHVIRPFAVNYDDYTVMEFLDPHPRNPDAIAWYAIDRNGTKFVIDELYIKCKSDEELAERIKKKASEYRVVRRFADPAAFVEDSHREGTDKSLAQKLKRLGLVYHPATKHRQASDRRIADALDYTEVNGNMIKAPEVLFFDTCSRHIWELEHYRWQEWTGKQADFHMPKEKPVDKDDHMIENLGRCLVIEPNFVERPVHAAGGVVQNKTNLDPY
ncbi:MAG: Terminase-like family protein [Parcubacteria group bacterium ADurb.Bin192]|nr:MAG: Terminase-like family protein [Parcubacteria group bacterium ADurb.Bin192]